MIDTLEENSYFKIVVKDAISDLKHNGSFFVFFDDKVCEAESLIDDIDL